MFMSQQMLLKQLEQLLFPVATEGIHRRPDRIVKSETDSRRGADPTSVKQSPFDCDAETTDKEKANFSPW